ncbi:hypothetical protein E4N90_03460 [Treponema denticola]|uniref:hypothetical protein n=1 Tax=Treponema denticola TaxID=158 RepID=UPI0020A58146|nr:hypothetical protein [Treponema denticola]UTD07048.1 hypothetical protein E4N90_03460 [Treponema denticola]
MKKTLFFILMILVLMVSSCNLFLKEEYGELILSFDGSLPDGARALDSNGLPSLLSSPMKINIIRENGYTITRELGAEEPKSLIELVPVGEKIGIKVILISDLAEWAGYAEHTVTAGPNRVVVELSKKSKGVVNLLFSITGKHLSGSNIVSLSTQNGKKLLDGILIGSTKPIAARDKVGRIYVLYEDTSSTRHLKRFDVEGKEDTGFEAALAAVLPSGVTISYIDNIAIDIDDNYIFLFKQNTVYCFKEKEDHSFQSFSYDSFPTVPAPVPSSSAVAVYDDVLFAVYNDTLFACGFEFEDLLTPGNKRLKFESQATRNPLDKLRTGAAFGNNRTECTGLFADESGVYCLLKEQELRHGKLYALGQLVCYTYSGSTFTKKAETGLNPAASTADPIAFNAQYFSNPVGFIGYDEENIYIADDGVNIGYINENWRIKGNKNRIATFNRGNGSLSFSDSGATWFTEHAVYKKPNTKILLWEKRSPAMTLSPMNYWTSETGTDTRPSNLLFEDSTSPTIEPTDVFCYDQDGNLYILWKDNSNYNVRRFALKEDGTYDKDTAETSDQNLDLTVPFSPNADCVIAVDISDGKKYLYYVDTASTPASVKRFEWNMLFGAGSQDAAYSISIPAGEKVTALAANKDGLFVGTRTMSIAPAGYTLSVKKYDKQDGADKGTIDVGSFQKTPTEPTSPPFDPYTKTIAFVNDLQVLDGVLYAVTSKEEYGMKKTSFGYKADTFKNSGKLYKIGSTKDGFSGSAVELAKKDPVGTAGNEVGYGFYRFIAVKYDEAERIRLIIASDGAWGKDGTVIHPEQPYCKNVDKVLEYDLKGRLQGEGNSGGSFSKTLQESGFEWN